ncbi:MAG TPA: hypothetical protein VG498_04595 [Terriglobales bacterium]|nr:hypothetical protein [Terriglobales bacterium]
MKTTLLQTVMIVMLTASAFTQQSGFNGSTGECGTPTDGIVLCLSKSGEPDGLMLEIRNVGAKDAVLNLGIMVGARQYPTAITLIFRVGGGPIPFELEGPGVISGRVDPLIVSLPSEASLKLTLHPTQYGLGFKDFVRDLKHYTVQAELTGRKVSQSQANVNGLVLMPYWMGTVLSNNVQIDRQ